jgi:hypothetical protein
MLRHDFKRAKVTKKGAVSKYCFCGSPDNKFLGIRVFDDVKGRKIIFRQFFARNYL